MKWLIYMFYDFFAALGALVFFSVVFVIIFNEGKFSGVSTAWFVALPLLYAWLMGELYRWPKERRGR